MNLKILFSITLLALTFCLNAQDLLIPSQLDKKSSRKYEKALDLIRQKNHAEAVDLLSALAEDYPGFYECRYKLAWQYLRLEQPDEARQEFEDILYLLPEPDYKLVLKLAELYEDENKYRQAHELMSYFLGTLDSHSRILDFVQRRIKELAFREHAYANPVNIDPVKLGHSVNSSYSEYLPAFNADKTKMIFTRRVPAMRGYQEDLYITSPDGQGGFSEAVPLHELNTSDNEGAHCFSQDGTILVFTACDRDNNRNGCDLYISFLNGDSWSDPVNMGPGINTRHWESQPALSADNKTLFFSSTRGGGQGKKDIWYVTFENGSWSEAKNMGSSINSSENEGSPFLHPDGKTFYFRSDGHIGLGDFDLFVSRKKPDQSWSEPANMGYPINSKYSEGALFVDLQGLKAYYTSDQFTESDNLDILAFDLPTHLQPQKMTYLLTRIYDADTGEKLQGRLDIISTSENPVGRSVNSPDHGEILMPISLGEHIINISKEGYIFYSENLLIDEQSDISKPLSYDVYLQKVPSEKGVASEPVILENIFFESGSSKLLDKSMPEIHRLANLIKNNDLQLQIVGHTDNIGSKEDNLDLSRLRAEAVFKALLELGIETHKISYEGRGEEEPIADNDSEIGRAMNRRTEFYIIKP